MGTVILACRIVIDNLDCAVRLSDRHREEIGHHAVAAGQRAADAAVTDLAVVHRLFGKSILFNQWARRVRVPDQRHVPEPWETGRSRRIGLPVRHVVAERV
jgi:hypothetical protein